ncbi:MAG: hypothetical protein JW742_00805 [Candidatus Aminicenantes bacterium]|nr:hypothetical protein [Candidatus Aminicenantes bacterium]
MRKAMILALALCLIGGIAACKKGGGDYAALGQYAEIGPTLDKFIAANEDFVTAIEKAASADEVAGALNAAAEKMTDLAPKMKAVIEKYPEFKTMDNPPEELKPLNDRIQSVMGRLMAAMGKAAPFMSDPKVQAAQEKYSQAMAGME